MDRIVKMWHFNRDSAYGYAGPKFDMDWKDALGVLRIYSKKAVRFEAQEYLLSL